MLIYKECGVSPQLRTRGSYDSEAMVLEFPSAGRAQWYGSRWKGIPRVMKPREEGLANNKPN